MWEIRVQSLGREDPLRRKWQPTPVLLPGKSHGWRSLIGYSPWGYKELDTTERLHFTSKLKRRPVCIRAFIAFPCIIISISPKVLRQKGTDSSGSLGVGLFLFNLKLRSKIKFVLGFFLTHSSFSNMLGFCSKNKLFVLLSVEK